MSNIPFYETPNGRLLLSKNLFPPEIIHYLEAEKKLIEELAANFDVVLELGCMEGSFAYLSSKLNIEYIGVDISQERISRGKAGNSNSKSQFLCGDALRFLKNYNTDPGKSTLAIFPFNSLGNMEEREELIVCLKEHQLDALILTYSDSDKALLARKKYYTLSKPADLAIFNTKNSVRFSSSNGLDSTTISTLWLNSLLRGCDYTILPYSFAQIGEARLIRFES